MAASFAFALLAFPASLKAATLQDVRLAECAMMTRVVAHQMQGVKQAEEKLALFNAKSDPKLTHAYLRELQQAVSRKRLAADFLRIAEHFAIKVSPGNSLDGSLWTQGILLSQAQLIAARVPEGSAPIRPDPARHASLKAKHDLAFRQQAAGPDKYNQRMNELRCVELPLPPARSPAPQRLTNALFNRTSPVPPARNAPANPYDACTTAAEKLVDLERKQDEAYLLRWAIDDNYHDSFFAVAGLRDAHKKGLLDEKFHEIANMFNFDFAGMSEQQKIAAQPALRKQVSDLMARARALTGRPRDKWIDPDAAGLEDMLLDDEDEEMPPVDSAVRGKEKQIEDDYFRRQEQTEQSRKQLNSLNCEDLPPPPPTEVGGPMKRIVTRTRTDKRGTYSTSGAYAYTYTDTSTRHEMTDKGVPIQVMTWNFFGIPESLGPGQTFTIQITGKLIAPSNYAIVAMENSQFASVPSQGLEIISQRKAVLHKGGVIPGQYVFRVPMNAKWVSFGLIDDDSNKGRYEDDFGRDDGFVVYCYGDCPKMHFRMN